MRFYLIDDSSESVFEIVNTVCRRLWKKLDDLELVVAFCGDDYKQTPMLQDAAPEEFENIRSDINEIFREVCFVIDREEWIALGTTYQKKKSRTQIECRPVSLKEQGTAQQIAAWRNIQAPDKDSGQEIDYSILHENTLPKELVEQLGIQPGELVALDICLWYDDYERCIQRLPVLSLALHHYLEAEHGCKCFLYSRMSVNTNAKSNWMEVYRQQFNVDPPEIHSRFNLGASASPDYLELEALLTTKGI